MAKIKITSNIRKVLKDKFKKIAVDLSIDDSLAGDISDTFRDFIRNTSSSPATGKKYPALKKATKKARAYIDKYNRTHSNYSKGEPNLTITGEFLDSIKTFFAVRTKGLLIKVNVKGGHKGYKKKKGRGKRVSNKIIRKRMIDLKRDPLEGSKAIRKDLVKLIQPALKEAARKLNL